MEKLSKDELQRLHVASYQLSKTINQSDNVGCFYCQHQFKATEIEEYVNGDVTALCPRCDTDSVMSLATFDTPEKRTDVLEQMHKHYFTSH